MDVLVGILILLPVVLIAVVAVLAVVNVRRSTLRITEAGIVFRNYPEPERAVPLADVDGFDEPTRVGFLSSVRPRTVVLVLTDGTRIPVRTASDPQAGAGVDALNDRLERVRRDR
jgi:hypothetical protein